MKNIGLFILKAITNYILELLIGLTIIWLGIPALLPSLKKYSWELIGDLFSIKLNLGIVLIILLGLVILYSLLQKFVLRNFNFKEYGGLLWKVNKKTFEVGIIPYCPKHRAKLVEIYIQHEEYPYTEFYCPLCGKDFKPEVTSYNIDNLYSEADSVIQARYNS